MQPPLELPVTFHCKSEQLIGIVHKPNKVSTLGVLVIVGGPQYRVGSHRQFVLLARHLAENDIAVMRFDYRGMGDSEGEKQSFLDIDADIKAAIDCFYQHCPELNGIVLWGLCDAASASLFYCNQDNRVKGLVLLNPWVFTEQGNAKTYLKHYYWHQLFNIDFWRKIFTLRFDYADSYASLRTILLTLIHKQMPEKWQNTAPLPLRMRMCWQRFRHPILLILSGRDLTASEFKEVVNADHVWQSLISEDRVTRYDLLAADHTFSSKQWRDQVAAWVVNWIQGMQ